MIHSRTESGAPSNTLFAAAIPIDFFHIVKHDRQYSGSCAIFLTQSDASAIVGGRSLTVVISHRAGPSVNCTPRLAPRAYTCSRYADIPRTVNCVVLPIRTRSPTGVIPHFLYIRNSSSSSVSPICSIAIFSAYSRVMDDRPLQNWMIAARSSNASCWSLIRLSS